MDADFRLLSNLLNENYANVLSQNAIRESIAILNQLMTIIFQLVEKMSSSYSLWIESAHLVAWRADLSQIK